MTPRRNRLFCEQHVGASAHTVHQQFAFEKQLFNKTSRLQTARNDSEYLAAAHFAPASL